MSETKKILLVSHEMSYTGAPRSLLNMTRIFMKMGMDVHVWTLNAGEFTKEFSELGIDVKEVSTSIYSMQTEIKQFDVVILNTFFTAKLVSYMQSLTRTILYIREAQNIPDLARDCGLDVKDIDNANEVICISEYAREFITKNYSPHNINVIHNFVKDEYRHKPNFVHDGIINYMISGTVERRKGHDVVIKAFLQMPEKLRKITRLHIVGRKPDWSKEFWNNLIPVNDERIIYHGEISDEKERLTLYEKMNVFIIASRDEACSLVALEGAMLGKALIMSENVGAKYLDISGRYIYLTEDVNDLCRKMCELTSRKELLVKGLEMRQQFLKTSTEKQYISNIQEVIRSLK